MRRCRARAPWRWRAWRGARSGGPRPRGRRGGGGGWRPGPGGRGGPTRAGRPGRGGGGAGAGGGGGRRRPGGGGGGGRGRDDGCALEQGLEALEEIGRPVGEVAQRAFLDLSALAVGLAQQDAGGEPRLGITWMYMDTIVPRTARRSKQRVAIYMPTF